MSQQNVSAEIIGLTHEARNERPWLTAKMPPGYVPGLGRGATGFTTRSDIGPAREQRATDVAEFKFHAGPALTDATTGMQIDPARHSGDMSARIRLQERQRKLDDAKEAQDEDKDTPAENAELNDGKFDKTFGYNKVLFNKTDDLDDVEADKIYDAIDNRMDERRRENREKRKIEELQEYRKKRPKIQQMFSDLKRKLVAIDEDDWMAIPEVGDVRKKKERNAHLDFMFDRVSSTPDTIILGNMKHAAMDTSLNALTAGTQTSLTSGTATSVRTAKTTMMHAKLSSAGDSVSGQTSVDPKGYLTEMASVIPQNNAGNIQDVKKGRQLLKSMRETNPQHAPSWISSARIEEAVGEIQKARNLIMEACEKCPRDENVWLEAARIQEPEMAKRVCATATQRLPKSTRIYIRAAQLETDKDKKRRVLRRALENCPESVQLWKVAVNLENNHDARIMLSRAVECCPTAAELWLALARLEDPDKAKQVLNRARKNIPTEKNIWIAAAQLEEQNFRTKISTGHVFETAEERERHEENSSKKIKIHLTKLISKAIESLKTNGVEINRDLWFKEAKKCENIGYNIVCECIVVNVISTGIEQQDEEHTWLEDVKECLSDDQPKKFVATARAIFTYALQKYWSLEGRKHSNP